MNYILVKKSDVEGRFGFAKELKDGRIVLPGNYLKVLAGKQVEIITESQAMVLIYGETKEEEPETDVEATETEETETKKGK